MCEGHKIDRRDMMKMLAAAGLGSLTGTVSVASGGGAMIPGKGWVEASGEACAGDGTPLQFIPKTAPDNNPLENELQKYPKCPYCGMDRNQWQHSRHLVHLNVSFIYHLDTACLRRLVEQCAHLSDLVHSNVMMRLGPTFTTQRQQTDEDQLSQ